MAADQAFVINIDNVTVVPISDGVYGARLEFKVFLWIDAVLQMQEGVVSATTLFTDTANQVDAKITAVIKAWASSTWGVTLPNSDIIKLNFVRGN